MKLIKWLKGEGNPPAVPTKFGRSTRIMLEIAGILLLVALYLAGKKWLIS